MRAEIGQLAGCLLTFVACAAAAAPPQESPAELLRRARARIFDARTAESVTLTYALRFADGSSGTYTWSQRDRDDYREEIRLAGGTSSRGALAGHGWQTPGRDDAAWWLVGSALAFDAQLAPDPIFPLASETQEIDGEAFQKLWAERPPELGRRLAFLKAPALDLTLSEDGDVRRTYGDWKHLRGVGAVPGICRVYVGGAPALEMRLDLGTNRPVTEAQLAPPVGAVARAHCSGDVVPPRLTKRTSPVYPAEARKALVQGAFVVAAALDADGAVTGARLVYPVVPRSDRRVLLGDAAVAAVRTWRYEPARCQGVPIATDLDVTVTFKLK